MHFILIIVSYLILWALAEENNSMKICKRNGEICSSHAECCSQLCQSFTYQCLPTSNLPPPAAPINNIPNVVVISPPTNTNIHLSLNELLDKLFPQTINTNDTSNGTILEDRISENNISVTRDEITTTTQKTDIAEDLTTIINREEMTMNNENINCLQKGQKCFENSICCSKRCHGYLHKCVS